jgi:hypothetical protein
MRCCVASTKDYKMLALLWGVNNGQQFALHMVSLHPISMLYAHNLHEISSSRRTLLQ